MSIRVVNLKNYRLDEGEVLVKVDRSSVLGNPFKMRFPTPAQSKRPEFEINERNRVCDEYEKYFMKKVKEEGDFRNEVIRIYRMVKSGKDVALGCWCFPKRCHAMYIKEFIEKYIEEPKGSSTSDTYPIDAEFRGKYWFLSNFYPCKITFGGLEFDCVEAGFQAMKCANIEDRKMFVGLNGAEAKKLGRKIKMRADWKQVRDDVMFTLVMQKFENPVLMRQLKAVKGTIIENNSWFDTYWGFVPGKGGENKLGKILMKIRDASK